jgi:ElaB/YqjD/DUF883 family membrane-anchored ribosome-binding protein
VHTDSSIERHEIHDEIDRDHHYFKKGCPMESSATNNFGKTAQALADKAADKVQSGIRGAQDFQSMGKQGLDSITKMAGRARDAASNTSDSMISYTKKNPVQALAIAAASGALLYALVKALRSSRD